MFTREEMHADQAEFRLLVLISKYARDPWHRSLTSQTGAQANGKWGAILTIIQSTTKMPRECAAVGCAELQTKESLFSFHTFPKDSSRRKVHLWKFELEIFPCRWPCGHPRRHNFLLRVSVMHLPAFARLIFGRRKERSLRMKPPSLPILQAIYPDRPKDKIKIKKGEALKKF